MECQKVFDHNLIFILAIVLHMKTSTGTGFAEYAAWIYLLKVNSKMVVQVRH